MNTQLEEQVPASEVTQHLNPGEMLRPELMERRIGIALEVCAFEPTPELKTAMTEFYTEHYGLASAVGSILDTDPKTIGNDERTEHISFLDALKFETSKTGATEKQIKDITEKGIFTADRGVGGPLLLALRIARLDNPEDIGLERAEITVAAAITARLFKEVSVGATTLGEQETELVQTLATRIQSVVNESGLFATDSESGRVKPVDLTKQGVNTYNDINPDLREMTSDFTEVQKKFWDDSRHAGQLLFHYSHTHEAIRRSGALRPRRMQMYHSGTYNAFNAKTVDGKTLWSPMVHWNEKFEGASPESVDAATFAVPIEKIVENAPYGRDAQYGVLTLKAGRAAEVDARLSVYADLGSSSTGDHAQGAAGSTDRSFYSSPHDTDPEAPIETAPDGHEFPLDSPDIYIVTIGSEQSTNAERYGRGEYFPTPYGILENFSASDLRQKPYEETKAIKLEAIRTLQVLSVSRHAGRVVAPIRSGVFDFSMSDELTDSRKPRPKFPVVL